MVASIFIRDTATSLATWETTLEPSGSYFVSLFSYVGVYAETGLCAGRGFNMRYEFHPA